jgi:hypothetical protein
VQCGEARRVAMWSGAEWSGEVEGSARGGMRAGGVWVLVGEASVLFCVDRRMLA